MKVIDFTSRLYLTTTITIAEWSTLPTGRNKRYQLWSGSPTDVPPGLLERLVCAITATSEDEITIDIFTKG